MGSVAGGLVIHGCKPGSDEEKVMKELAANQQYFGRTLRICFLVGFAEERFRKCGNISLYFHDRNSALALKFNLVAVLHLNLHFLLPPDVLWP